MRSRGAPVLLCATLALAGCATVRPIGWPENDALPDESIGAPGNVFTGRKPTWTLPGGEVATLIVERAEVLSGFGLYKATVHFDLVTEHEHLRCETEPKGPGVPETRWGCWSVPGPEHAALTFWIAPGAGCAARHARYVDTLTDPLCWDGEATIDGHAVVLRHATFKDLGSPYPEVTWLAPGHDVGLLAADLTNGLRVYSGEPSGPLPPELRRRLLLLTIALQYWEAASSPD